MSVVGKILIDRPQATEAEIEAAMAAIREALRKRINKHGSSKFVTRAEAMGTLVEEYHEVVEAKRGNNLDEFLDEMMDVCITCVWTEISLRGIP